MKPTLLLLVRSRNGAATALAEVGRRRATDLGVGVEILPLREDAALARSTVGDHETSPESVTAIVPVDFAVEHHEAWCLLCHLSLMRREVAFSILVLGAQAGEAFEARQRALIVGTGTRALSSSSQPRRRRRAA
ncbi:MAG: hypothetical protein V4773_10555 [Verrucomicrobiota bacterium]